MDDIDRASEREQELTREALSKRMPEGPKATGYCLQCGAETPVVKVSVSGWDGKRELAREPMDIPRRWCDSQCRDDWERAQTKG